eukprot:jgi/Mesen1/4169/ME000219S03298
MATMTRAVELPQQAPELSAVLEKMFLADDQPKPQSLGSGEVLVRMKIRPVNPSDVMALMGHYAAFEPDSWPAIPGFEGMGVVEALGEGVTNLKVGQRVVPLLGAYGNKGHGSWQEYVKVKQEEVIRVPDAVSDESAAQFFINPWTVVGLVDSLQVPKGEYLLQNAAASALGRQLVQYAKAEGVKTINLVRRNEHRQTLTDLGADVVINSEEEDVHARVMEVTGGKGAFGALEPVGGPMTKVVAACVRDRGQVLVYGALAGGDVLVSATDLLFRGVTMRGFYLYRWLEGKFPTPEKLREFGEQHMMQLLAKGVMKPPVGPVFKLEDFKAAVQESQKSGQKGKVLLVG